MQSDREQLRVVSIARQPILDFRLKSEANGRAFQTQSGLLTLRTSRRSFTFTGVRLLATTATAHDHRS